MNSKIDKNIILQELISSSSFFYMSLNKFKFIHFMVNTQQI